jgi:guanylate kinase
MSRPQKGKLVVISGPSGTGKSTVVQQLLRQCPLPLTLSVSATTRPPREGERDGVDYHFMSPQEFARRRDNREFLEYKEVFGRGDFYGTLLREVASGLKAGNWVVLEIDVEGAIDVFKWDPDAISIFLHPGSMEELEGRLRGRMTESEESIQRRLDVARRELGFVDRYRHRVVNKSVDQAVCEICEILTRSGD